VIGDLQVVVRHGTPPLSRRRSCPRERPMRWLSKRRSVGPEGGSTTATEDSKPRAGGVERAGPPWSRRPEIPQDRTPVLPIVPPAVQGPACHAPRRTGDLEAPRIPVGDVHE